MRRIAQYMERIYKDHKDREVIYKTRMIFQKIDNHFYLSYVEMLNDDEDWINIPQKIHAYCDKVDEIEGHVCQSHDVDRYFDLLLQYEGFVEME